MVKSLRFSFAVLITFILSNSSGWSMPGKDEDENEADPGPSVYTSSAPLKPTPEEVKRSAPTTKEEAEKLKQDADAQIKEFYYREAISYLETSLLFERWTNDERAALHSKIAYCYEKSGPPDQRIFHLNRQLEFTRPELRDLILIQIGDAYTHLKLIPQAVQYYEAALRLMSEPSSKARLAFRLGEHYSLLQAWEKAASFSQQALDYYQKPEESPSPTRQKFCLEQVAKLKLNLGLCHKNLGNLKEARAYLNGSLEASSGDFFTQEEKDKARSLLHSIEDAPSQNVGTSSMADEDLTQQKTQKLFAKAKEEKDPLKRGLIFLAIGELQLSTNPALATASFSSALKTLNKLNFEGTSATAKDYWRRGIAYLSAGNLPLAYENIDFSLMFVKDDSERAELCYEASLAFAIYEDFQDPKVEKLQKSSHYFEKARKYSPSEYFSFDEQILYEAGLLGYGSKRSASAKELLGLAISQHPDTLPLEKEMVARHTLHDLFEKEGNPVTAAHHQTKLDELLAKQEEVGKTASSRSQVTDSTQHPPIGGGAKKKEKKVDEPTPTQKANTLKNAILGAPSKEIMEKNLAEIQAILAQPTLEDAERATINRIFLEASLIVARAYMNVNDYARTIALLTEFENSSSGDQMTKQCKALLKKAREDLDKQEKKLAQSSKKQKKVVNPIGKKQQPKEKIKRTVSATSSSSNPKATTSIPETSPSEIPSTEVSNQNPKEKEVEEPVSKGGLRNTLKDRVRKAKETVRTTAAIARQVTKNPETAPTIILDRLSKIGSENYRKFKPQETIPGHVPTRSIEGSLAREFRIHVDPRIARDLEDLENPDNTSSLAAYYREIRRQLISTPRSGDGNPHFLKHVGFWSRDWKNGERGRGSERLLYSIDYENGVVEIIGIADPHHR